MADHVNVVFGHRRPGALILVLESLRRQGELAHTQVWLDGHQEFPELYWPVETCRHLRTLYPEAEWFLYGSNCGSVKLFHDAVRHNAEGPRVLVFLEDDCFPAPGAIAALVAAVEAAEAAPGVFSAYGHHFGTEDEPVETTAFQCWGWATTAAKLGPVAEDFFRLWLMPEPEAVRWFARALTPEIRARMDVFHGRSESSLLERRFCFDAVLSFLIAQRRMTNRKTPEQVVYNFGIGERSGHFTRDDERFYRPPFNMARREDLIHRFGLDDLPDGDALARMACEPPPP